MPELSCEGEGKSCMAEPGTDLSRVNESLKPESQQLPSRKARGPPVFTLARAQNHLRNLKH